MAESIEDKLLRWKKEIETDKTERAKLEGQLEGNMKTAKSEFNITTIEELQEKMETTQKNIEKLSNRAEELAKNYEEKYYGESNA